MKNYRLTLFFIVLVLAFTSCSTGSITKPEQVGERAFEILKNLEAGGFEGYSESLISLEQMHELAANEELDIHEFVRAMMAAMTQEEISASKENAYNKLIDAGKENGIDWSAIEFVDYTIEKQKEFGKDVDYGKLTFKHNDKSYAVTVSPQFNGKEYLVMGVSSLKAL